MNIGLVCISEILKAKNKTNAFQTMTRSRFNSLKRDVAIADLSKKILHNSRLCGVIIHHCAVVGIKHYRISSNLFPLITDSTLNLSYSDLPDFEEIKSRLQYAGDLAVKLGVSISAHPDQFNVLSSFSNDTVAKTIKELNHQSYVLDMFGCKQDYSSPMCLHLNLSFDSVKETLASYADRFFKAFELCNAGVRSRLVLENEDKGFWNAENLYNNFGSHLPLVFDNLHDAVNPSPVCHFDLFKSTWRSYTPVMHWSEGIKESPRSHAEYATHMPDVVKLNNDCVWEFELKGKDKAILKVLNNDYTIN
jgi:UV DNA damage endonuclease